MLSLGDFEVQAALDRLRAQGLTRVIHPSHGARTPKHRQVLDEVLGLDPAERAVVTLLLLRGAQTPGELRSRSDRLHDFDSLDQVNAALHMLSVRDDPLVEELPRQPGSEGDALGPPPRPRRTARRRRDRGAAVSSRPVRRATRRSSRPTTRVATAYADELLDELDRKPFDRWLLERIAELSAGGPVADVGCGPGQIDGAPRAWRAPTSRASTCRPAWSPRRVAASPTSRSRSPTWRRLPPRRVGRHHELVLARAPRPAGAAGHGRRAGRLAPARRLARPRGARGRRDAPPRRVVRSRRGPRLRVPPPRATCSPPSSRRASTRSSGTSAAARGPTEATATHAPLRARRRRPYG